MSKKAHSIRNSIVTKEDEERLNKSFVVTREEELGINKYVMMKFIQAALDGVPESVVISDIEKGGKELFVAEEDRQSLAFFDALRRRRENIKINEDNQEDDEGEDLRECEDDDRVMKLKSKLRSARLNDILFGRGNYDTQNLHDDDKMFEKKSEPVFGYEEDLEGISFIKQLLNQDIFSSDNVFSIHESGIISSKQNDFFSKVSSMNSATKRHYEITAEDKSTTNETLCVFPMVVLVNALDRGSNFLMTPAFEDGVRIAILVDAVAVRDGGDVIMTIRNPKIFNTHVVLSFPYNPQEKWSDYLKDRGSNKRNNKIYIDFISDVENYDISSEQYEKATKAIIKDIKGLNDGGISDFLTSLTDSEIFKSDYSFGKLMTLCNLFAYFSSFDNPMTFKVSEDISSIENVVDYSIKNGLGIYIRKGAFASEGEGYNTDTLIQFNERIKKAFLISSTREEITDKLGRHLQIKQGYVRNERERSHVSRYRQRKPKEQQREAEKELSLSIHNSDEVLAQYISEFHLNSIEKGGGRYGSDREDRLKSIIRSIPFGRFSEVSYNIGKIKEALDDKIYGLDSVKAHIVDYLAVMARNPDLTPPVICLAGPPGIGKTTICKTIADSINRKYYMISCSGMSESFSLIGSNQTYSSSKEGGIISSLIHSKTMNPLILLDEIDKSGTSHHNGNVQDALTAILDPVQNDAFTDQFLGFPVDISKVQFITTANDLDTLSSPLRNRMSIIELPGYNDDEKLIIMKKSVIPEIFKDYRIKDSEVSISDNAISQLIEKHGGEPGIREIKRVTRNLFARVVSRLESGEKSIAIDNIDDFQYVGSETKRTIGFE